MSMKTKQELAFLFPGQGSQKVGMLSDYADNEVLLGTFAEASDVLGYDVWQAIVDGPQERINLTEITQPLLLTSSVALWRLWSENTDVRPGFVAGHSLGEWSALVCVGSVAFDDALNLVRLRGRFMQEAVPEGEGAMAAIIGLADDRVEAICAEKSAVGVVSAVNYNSPGQLVIAGTARAVEEAVEACRNAGAKKAMALPVSAPFHTSLMKPAADRLAEHIGNTVFGAPTIPVVHNVHAGTESDPEKIKTIMVEQVYSPVRWVSCIEFLVSNRVVQCVECGPGKVLSGLNRRIDKSIQSSSIDSSVMLESTIENIHQAC